MSAGLQVFDADGDLMLDTSTNVWKKLGEFTTCYNDGDGSITFDSIGSNKIMIYQKKIEVVRSGGTTIRAYPYRFSIEDTKISWKFVTNDMDYWYFAQHTYRNANTTAAIYRVTWEYGWYE